MNREIKIGDRTAVFSVTGVYANLTIQSDSLPVILADEIDRFQDITVEEIINLYDKNWYILIHHHDLKEMELLEIVCKAMRVVYNVEMSGPKSL